MLVRLLWLRLRQGLTYDPYRALQYVPSDKARVIRAQQKDDQTFSAEPTPKHRQATH